MKENFILVKRKEYFVWRHTKSQKEDFKYLNKTKNKDGRHDPNLFIVCQVLILKDNQFFMSVISVILWQNSIKILHRLSAMCQLIVTELHTFLVLISVQTETSL